MAKIKIRRPEEPSEKKQFHKELKTRKTLGTSFKFLLPFTILSIALNIYFLTR
jgi:hypothetical protein